MTGPLRRVGPILAMMFVLVIAAVLGYLWAASGIEIKDTGPWQLHKSYQGYYVQAVADAYAADHNQQLAADRLSFLCQTNGGLNDAFGEAAARWPDSAKAQNLAQLQQQVVGNVHQNSGVAVCSTTPLSAPVPSIVPLGGLILLALIIVGVGVFQMIQVNEAGEAPATAGTATAGTSPPTSERARPTLPGLPGLGRKKPDQAGETVRSAAAQGAQISRAVEKTDFTAQGAEPPLVQFMTTYLHGDDLYDDSFSIETPSGEFLGETGVGISETLGSSDSKNVTAFEVWLFDKNDIRTVTKVIMSDHAFNDDAVRARLAPKGEAVKAEPGMRVQLETASLRIQGRIVDLSYIGGPVPPNGVFDRITIELAAWKKDGQGGPAPMATPSRANLPGSGGGGTPPGMSPIGE